MRRLGMLVFLTGAFCPPIALLLMLVPGAIVGDMDWLTSRTDLMLLGLWGAAVLLLAALTALGCLASAKRQGKGSW
ncbi:hypothetical protein [Methylobacterium nigriterrae]|uniref:hypothetical protein n=1 Tax=Methylobacterium nigriterrae TaxID=3127512 RepID=UPI003013F612